MPKSKASFYENSIKIDFFLILPNYWEKNPKI